MSKNCRRERGVAIISQLVSLAAGPGSALRFPLILLNLTIKLHCFHTEERRAAQEVV